MKIIDFTADEKVDVPAVEEAAIGSTTPVGFLKTTSHGSGSC